MNAPTKVLLNTIILYIRIIITTILSLVSVPMILNALGKSDYGLYNLIAGVISMLAFLNASMAICSQRFMSVAIGENDKRRLNSIYNVSIVLHLLIGAFIVLIFEIASLFLFDGQLNIEPDRVEAAKVIYHLLVVSTFFTVIAVPYDAVMNAKENMLVFSLVSIVDAILKLALAYYLLSSNLDRLIVYAVGMAVITVFSSVVTRFCVKFLYKEFYFKPREYFSMDLFKQMFGFASWNTFGSIAMIGRNQGVAIIINLFFGTIANAAYGIANQINGVLGTFASTFQKALNPQLMQSEGMKNRERLIKISFISSKFSVIVLGAFVVPLVIEMPYVLELWLKDVPEHTIRVSQLILLLGLTYQYSVGLMSSIQAVGKIRNYQITMSILILLNLPVSYILYQMGLPMYTAMIAFIVIEWISLLARTIMSKKLVGINPSAFFKEVLFPTISIFFVSAIVALIPHFFMSTSFIRLSCVVVVFETVYLAISFLFILNKEQKSLFISKFKSICHV